MDTSCVRTLFMYIPLFMDKQPGQLAHSIGTVLLAYLESLLHSPHTL
jgi:hypothetical protein